MKTTAAKFEPRGRARSLLGNIDGVSLEDIVRRGEMNAVRTVTGRRLYDVGSYIAAKAGEGYALVPLDGSKPDVLSLVRPALERQQREALQARAGASRSRGAPPIKTSRRPRQPSPRPEAAA